MDVDDSNGNDLTNGMLEWLPNQGDCLFVPSATGVRLNPLGSPGMGEQRSPVGRWQLYADGFLTAGDRLVDGMRGIPSEDALIYPILNLYRHHLELELKYVIRCFPGDEELNNWLTRTHGLKALWNKMAEIYPRSGAWASPECTNACYSLISEFDGHDPNSQSSRYPVDRIDNQTFLGLEVVDLQLLKLGVSKISHYLETVIEQIGQDQEWESEMRNVEECDL